MHSSGGDPDEEDQRQSQGSGITAAEGFKPKDYMPVDS
jgi:hypothetical protein